MSNRGKPMMADKDDNRCEALTQLTEWKRSKHVTDLRCPYMVKFEVGYKRLCYRHALLESLATLIERGATRIIPSPPRPRYGAVPTINPAKRRAKK